MGYSVKSCQLEAMTELETGITSTFLISQLFRFRSCSSGNRDQRRMVNPLNPVLATHVSIRYVFSRPQGKDHPHPISRD